MWQVVGQRKKQPCDEKERQVDEILQSENKPGWMTVQFSLRVEKGWWRGSKDASRPRVPAYHMISNVYPEPATHERTQTPR